MKNTGFAVALTGVSLCLAAGISSAASVGKPLTAAEILSRAIQRTEVKKENAASGAAVGYTQLSITEELDSKGRVKQRNEKVWEMVHSGGKTRATLISMNGNPPPEEELKKQAENEGNAKQVFGGRKGDKGDQRETFLSPELVDRFVFTLVGQETLNGRPAYKMTFTPKTTKPSERLVMDRFLSRIAGTVWIDAADFEIARANIHLQREVNLLAGILGSLKKLDYSVTRKRVADGLWVNSSASGDFQGRKFLDSTRIRLRTEASDFKPLTGPLAQLGLPPGN